MAALGRQFSKFGRSVVSEQTQAGDCVLSQNIAKPMLFLGFGSFFGSGGSKLEKLQQPMAESAQDTFQIRLRELRRLQTRKKEAQGCPKSCHDCFPRSRGHGRDGFWLPWGRQFSKFGGNMVSKTDPSWRLCAEPKLSKTYAFPGFWQLFCFWRVGNSRNCSNRWLKELKTRPK